MDVKWDYQLKDYQSANPVVDAMMVKLPEDFICPTEADLLQVFKTGGFKLQTWGRKKDESGKAILLNDPHWIAVRGGTPLHYDPKYPRYSHQLKIMVDDGTFCRGLDKHELEFARGLYYVLDAHSPHQVFHKRKDSKWNVSISMDSKDPLPCEETIGKMIEYGYTEPLIPVKGD